MAIVRIEEFADGVVLYFQTDEPRINAYTLASSLVHFADAARAANRTINPGYDLEIVVEALASGSFKAKINAIYRSAGNLFSTQSLQTIVLAIVANFIYEKIHSPAVPVKIAINADEVTIDRGTDQIIVPRNVYSASQDAALNPRFADAIKATISSISEDEHITGLGLQPTLDTPTPQIVIPREVLKAYFPESSPEIVPIERTIVENCDLQIVKAILERSDRKWEFRWRGVKISASVSDDAFYTNFFAHNITIAPGDELQVRMAIQQSRNPLTDVYTNLSYEVVEVLYHRSKFRQTSLPELPSN